MHAVSCQTISEVACTWLHCDCSIHYVNALSKWSACRLKKCDWGIWLMWQLQMEEKKKKNEENTGERTRKDSKHKELERLWGQESGTITWEKWRWDLTANKAVSKPGCTVLNISVHLFSYSSTTRYTLSPTSLSFIASFFLTHPFPFHLPLSLTFWPPFSSHNWSYVQK